jgi:Sec-independent protein translocase protein TatA
MAILQKIFVLAFIAMHMTDSYGFLSHQQKSLLHLDCPGRLQQPNSASLAIDTKFKHPTIHYSEQSVVLIRHRRSVANVQTMGVFGLGAAEIAIVLAVGAFIIGPQQLGNMVGSITGKAKSELPDELKKIPLEFQKGFEESTENSKARNAKKMEALPDDENGARNAIPMKALPDDENVEEK